MLKPGKPDASSALWMKAVIIYDDFAFLANASAALKRAGCRPEVSAQWIIKNWPVKALHQLDVAETVLFETADAHLLVLPARLAHSLPFWLRDWLERWAALRQIQDAALAVMGEDIGTDFTGTVSPELARLALRHGLILIADGGAPATAATSPLMRLSLGPGLPLPIDRSHFPGAVTREPFRGFGINE